MLCFYSFQWGCPLDCNLAYLVFLYGGSEKSYIGTKLGDEKTYGTQTLFYPRYCILKSC